MKTSTPILISAMRILAADIISEDGIANAVILEAAERLEELDATLSMQMDINDVNIETITKLRGENRRLNDYIANAGLDPLTNHMEMPRPQSQYTETAEEHF